MKIVFRILSALIGVLFFLNAVHWMVDADAAAEGLGMPLLTGIAASTQVGDLSAFFLTIAVFIGLGQRAGHARWLVPAAMLLAGAALMRSMAWLVGYSPFATPFIVSEVVTAVILAYTYHLRSAESPADGGR
jgi:hypothetical protein